MTTSQRMFWIALGLWLSVISHPVTSAAQDSPFDEILGTTTEEEEMLAPVELASVTASDGTFDATVILGAVFAQQQGTVRVKAKNVGDASALLHVALVISLGKDYYPINHKQTERIQPGEEKRIEIPYRLPGMTDTARARVVVARVETEQPAYPPEGIFLSVATDARRDAKAQIWKPEIRRIGNLSFHYAKDLFSEEEFEKRAALYADARKRVDAFWGDTGDEVIPVYLFADESEKDLFLMSEDEEREYPRVVIDYPVDGERQPPGKLLSWARSIFKGNPPTLFHDAIALLSEATPEWEGKPLDDWIGEHRDARDFIPLEKLLRYDRADPEDATRVIGIPEIASVVEYLRTIRDPEVFGMTFLYMERGSEDIWLNHNANTIQGYYDLDLESLEKEWLHWLDGKHSN